MKWMPKPYQKPFFFQQRDVHLTLRFINNHESTIMEFLEFLMLTASVLLLLFKPEKEKLAWNLLIISWAVVVFMYIGHVSNAILGVLNL